MVKSLSSWLSTKVGWDIFFGPWLVTVEFLSFVSARKVVRWFELEVTVEKRHDFLQPY
jgi:hypothetical protein